MNKYIIDFSTDSRYHAGSKARSDINDILHENNYKLLTVSQNATLCGIRIVDRIANKVIREFHLVGAWFAHQLRSGMQWVEKGAVVILQYPFYPQYSNYDVVETIRDTCTQKHCTLIILVHDIDSLRNMADPASVKEELRLIGYADAIILHNHAMKERVVSLDATLTNRIYELELFDYKVSDTCPMKHARFARKVTIAGNLAHEKAQYVYHLGELQLENVEIDLYGVNYTGTAEGAIQYKGIFTSENVPFCEGFGLVWDGDSIESCAGSSGEYTKINNPHKLSLYMAAGIPVIVWRQAAIARFVEENHVGICVESLYEIDSLISKMSEETYRELADHVAIISAQVRNGWYTKTILDRVYDEIAKVRKENAPFSVLSANKAAMNEVDCNKY